MKRPPPASTNAIRPCAPGVHRVRLDAFNGLLVNVYVLEIEGGVALIDSGFPHTLDQLESTLSDLGYQLHDVREVFYTHTHYDHLGGGLAAAARWAARDWVWEGMSPLVGKLRAHLTATRFPLEWPLKSVPAEDMELPLMQGLLAKPMTIFDPDSLGELGDPRLVAFGETVSLSSPSLGTLDLECIDARGHDPHHCAWFERSRGWLFSGDAILPTPVPLMRGMGDRADTWLETLDRWEETLEVQWLFPGHGAPTILFEAWLRRSRRWLETLYNVTVELLESREQVRLLDILDTLQPEKGRESVARAAVVLSAAETLLWELEEQGVVERPQVGFWSRSGVLPPFRHSSD